MHLNDSPLDDLELLDLLLEDDEPPAAPAGATEFRREDGPPPLSRAQRRLWFLQQVAPDSPAYNIFAAVRLSGRLDRAALASALAEIVRRHESLRMSFPAVDGRPEVRVHAAGPFDLTVEEVPSEAVSRLAAEEARRPFDLATGPLFRLRLLRLAGHEHVALLTLHHSVADGWSMGVFVAELGELYRAFTLGAASPLPEPEWQYSDYARWQERWLASDAAAEQRRWWLDRLAGLATLELPTDRPRPTEPSHRGGTHVFQVPDALAASLKALARREGATLYMALLAAFAVLLHRYTGQDDIVVGTPVANRHRRELESLIGFFVNSLVMRCDLSGDPGFGEVLRRVRDFVGDALARQDLPFEELVKALAPERETGSNPLFQVMFSLESTAMEGGLRLPELTLAPVEADSGVAKFDLLLNFTETATGLSGAFEYARDLFEPDTIQRMAGHWLTLLSAAVADPGAAVATLPLLTAQELAQLAEWNATAAPYPREAGLAELFEEWAARTPDAIAVEYGAERLTYAELNARADRLAHRLRECGVGLETPVAVHARRSVGMVAGLLGILKAGGYYVPLDPAYPRQRLELMLADCGAQVLLTETGLLEQWAPDGLEAICLDRDESHGRGDNPSFNHPHPSPPSTSPFDCAQGRLRTGLPRGEGAKGGHLAYVIYTSGSTGTPKGAAVPQRAVSRLVLNCDYAPLTPDDRVAQASNASFDAATFEIWGALLNGARLVGVDQDTVLSPPDFAAFLRARQITTLFLTTALFNQMARETPDAFAPLRHLLFGGEQVDPHWVREVLRRGPPERLLHVYGPTENTTFSTWHRVREVAPDAKTVPIGRAIANTRLYVLDARHQVLPVGVPGELYLAGDGLARGYLGRPDLTDERFVQVVSKGSREINLLGASRQDAKTPSEKNQGHLGDLATWREATLYKTGDIVRRLADGEIEFIGRRDSQVKIRGFRIELGEIESALLRHPEVREAVVLAREDRPGSRRLVAYVVASGEWRVASEGGCSPIANHSSLAPSSLTTHHSPLATFLKQSLPDYMVPASFVFLDALPLNRNGKIDRQALPAPAETAEPDAACEPPQGEREQCLAAVWRDVLGGPDVGRHDNYFERGGDSITAIQVVSRLRRHGWQARVADVFRHPTVAQLAPQLVADQSGAEAADEVAGSADVPLTPVQHWFFEHYHNDERRHFNQAVLLTSAERLEEEPLRAALDELLRRHDALRLRYADEGADMRQSCIPAGEVADLTVLELPANADTPAELARQADALHASLDLKHGPLLKVGLFRCADADRLLLVVHHLAVDGVSWRILLEELALAYQHSAAGVPIDLGPKTCSFRRWAGALADFAESEALRAESSYWQAIEQAEATRLPTRPDGGAGKHGEVESAHASLAPDITAELLGAAHRAFGTEIMDLLLTALGRALSHWSGGAATRITLEGHGREPFDDALDLTRTVGWFTSIYPFLLRVAGDDVGAQIQAMKAALRAVPRKGLGYGVLRYLTSDSGVGQSTLAERSRSQLTQFASTPLGEHRADPQLSFNYLGQFEDGGGSAGLFGFAEESSGRAIGPRLPRAHELDMVCLVSGGRLLVTLEFNPAALDRATADGLVRDFIAQLETVARHCREVAAQGGAADSAPIPTQSSWAHLPVTGEVEDAYPLSPLQEGFLFQSLLDPDSESYFVQVRFQFAGRLDADAFRDAWYALCRRHAVLRSAFVHRDLARPLQAVLRDRVPDLSFHDLRDMDAERRRAHLAAYCLDQRRRGFDLEREPLLRVAVFREGAADHHIVWSYHHILIDGWCLSIVYRDFVELYMARLAGRPARLPPPVPYRRYIDWLEACDSAAARRYWREYLAGYEHLATLPRFGGARDAAAERVLAEETLVFDAATTAGLAKLAARAGATLNAVLRGLWGLVLSRYNDRDEVVFGSIVSGRPAELPGVEEMVGLFISAIPVRVTATPDLPFIDVVRAVRDAALAAESHQYLSLADIQKESVLGGNLFDHMLIFENYPLKAMGGGGADSDSDSEARAEFTPVEAYDPTHYDLDLTVTPGEALSVKFTYNTAVYRPDQMRRTAGHLRTAALTVIESPERAVRDIPILPGWESRQILEDFNATQADYPAELGLVELFEAQATRIPDAPALRCGDFTASYRELNAAANRLAHRLRASGVAPGTTVGLCVGRTPAMIVGPLAIMKAGGVFVPLDPDYPRERLAFMVEDAGIAVLLADEEVISRPTRFSKPSRPLPSIPLNADGGTDGDWPAANPPRQTGPADTAYLIYTSGSTGWPKGVAVAHRSLANMAQAWRTSYRLDDFPVRLLQLASMSFDVFVGDLIRALTNGGTLVVCPADAQIDPPSLYGLLVENGISLFESTPGVLLPLMEHVHRHGLALDELRLLIVGSDSLPARHFQTLVERFGSRFRIVNSYGVTEATIDSSFFESDGGAGLDLAANTPIGKPLSNTRFYVLDRHGRPQPIGVPGELYIGGDGVAKGYLNRPELTAERFVPLDFAGSQAPAWESAAWKLCFPSPGDASTQATGSRASENPVPKPELGNQPRLYRTGDLARWLPDGNMEFLGRIDSQVKVRGYRIELGEIEDQLLRFDSVEQAVVLARDIGGGKDLAAYVVADERWDVGRAREFLRGVLPAYMVPAFFVRLERFPLTPNGKIDRRALPDPLAAAERTSGLVPPRTATEAALVDIWREVLQVAEIGVLDNFFELGGHSLKAMQIVGLIHKRFGVEVPLRQVFIRPTLAGQAEWVAGGSQSDWSHIAPAPRQDSYELSYAQRRLWLLGQLDHSAAYNMPEAHLIRADIDGAVLNRAFRTLIQRHEALRTAFVVIDDEPRQVIRAEVPFAIAEFDLRASPDPDRAAREIVDRDAAQPFDLTEPPLLRVSLAHLPGGRSLFALTMHHIVGDGWSGNIVLRELLSLYDAYRQGQPDPLKPLRIQYKDYAAWQHARGFEGQERYWLERLAGMAPGISLPYDFPPSGERAPSAGLESLDLAADTVAGLRRIAARRGITLSNVLLGVFELFLSHWTGQDDLCIGLSVANRGHPDLENLIGFFVNLLPIRCRLSAEMDLDELLNQVAERVQEALERQDYPFDLLVQRLNPARQSHRQPLVNVIYAYQNFTDLHVAIAGEGAVSADQVDAPAIEWTGLESSQQTAKYDLTLVVQEEDAGLRLALEYDSGLFLAATIREQLQTLAEFAGMVAGWTDP